MMTDYDASEPIALVGVSLRLPGGIRDLNGLWTLLQSGTSTWTPVPADRYTSKASHRLYREISDDRSIPSGGYFLADDIRVFDHAFFKLTEAQARTLDPQQRLLLELTYEALESAGLSREAVSGSATSVYAAISSKDYERQLFKDPLDLPLEWNAGVNLISHAFNLCGPSFTLETRSADSLAAVHLACQSLRDGESETTIVAASNLILSPDHFLGLGNSHTLSTTGHCYPFDERMGEGYGLGEGVVVLVLKPLKTAIRDRHPIHGVIRSTAVGKESAQAALAHKAHARADLRLEDTSYVEVLSVGSNTSSPEQLNAIAEAFHSASARSSPLYLGSIEGAIGHVEGAAGLASLVKAILMLEHESVPPVAGFNNPHPDLRLDQIAIPTKVEPWPRSTNATPRIAVHSFGFDGTNAHAILERGPRTTNNEEANDSKLPRLFTLSASSPASLKTMIEAHRDWIQQRAGKTSLRDVSYTLQHCRTALPYRFSAVAEDCVSLLEAFENGIRRATMTKSIPVQQAVVAVFTGQGAQWAGMGRELLLETTPSSVFRDSIRTSRNLLHGLGATWDLEKELMRDIVDSRLNEAELAYPATTAVQIALVELLRSQGVRLRAVVGHSSGEVAAAYAAGHISHAVAIKVAYHSGCMAAVVKARGLGRGVMLSVGLGEGDVAPYLENLKTGKAVVACVNSPRSVTIAGDADAVNEVSERIEATDSSIFHRLLLVETAYHSHHMSAVADDYRTRLGKLQVDTPSDEIIFISSVSGEPKTSAFDEEYWIANLVSPVRFSDAIQTLANTPDLTGYHVSFVELGPHPALMGPVRQTLRADQFTFDYFGSLQRKVGATASMLALAGRLFEQGVEISWDTVMSLAPGTEAAVVQADLPPYPWDHSTEHWHESRLSQAYRLREEPYHHFLGVPVPDSTTIEPRWRQFISHKTLPWIKNHVIDGLTVLPESTFVCMAAEAVVRLFLGNRPSQALDTVALRDVSFPQALAVSESDCVELQLSLQRQPHSQWAFHFTVTALSGDTDQWHEYATGWVEAVLTDDGQGDSASKERLPLLPTGSERVSHEALYRDLADAGNTYGPGFAALDFLTISPDLTMGQSSFEVRGIGSLMPMQRQSSCTIHPTTLNTVFQSAIFLSGRRPNTGSIVVTHVDELLIAPSSSLQQEGSRLDISTHLTTNKLHTSVSDLSVLANHSQVLSVSGLECRRRPLKVREAYPPRQICYVQDWTPAVEFLRAQNMPDGSGFATILEYLARTLSTITTIGLGVSIDLSDEFLHGLQLREGQQSSPSKVLLHDFVDVTHGRFHDAAERLKGYPVQFRTLLPGTDPIARGFQHGGYNIVLAGSPKWLDQAGVLVKPGGFVVLVASSDDERLDGWRNPLASTQQSQLEEIIAVRDESDQFILLAQLASPPPATQVHILTHSTPLGATADWPSLLQKGIQEMGYNVSTNSLTDSALEMISDNDTVILCESSERPSLSDLNTFNAIKTLLGKPSQVVWLSPNHPASLHQIRGIARAAQAENDDLRLVTIHFAPGHEKSLIRVVNRAIAHISNPEIPHTEREYLIQSDGAVVVPRLKVSERLNEAVAMGRTAIQLQSFQNSKHSLALSPDAPGVFVDQGEPQAPPLDADAVEVETAAFAISKSDSKYALGQLVGVVTAAGANVTSLSLGDRVVAVAPVLGANRVRIAASQAHRLPEDVPDSLAAGLLLDTMAAWHAILGVARVLSSQATVMIHGARTSSGRAAVAVARSLGARVTATAATTAEANLLRDELGIEDEDVITTRPSIHRRVARDVFPRGLDAVIQIDHAAVPADALMRLKPFGAVVILANPSEVDGSLQNMPTNTVLHYVDIASLVRARPDLTSSLIAGATATLAHVPLAGLNLPVHEVSEVADASDLSHRGQSRVVLQGGPESMVPTIPAVKPHDRWTNTDATYVFVGDLTVVGQRLIAQIASRGASHIAILSSRPADREEHHRLQAELEAIRPGIHLYTLQCDVASDASVRAAATVLLNEDAPPVRGVIQATGIQPKNCRLLSQISYEEFTRATGTEVDATLALTRAFASADLAFVLSVSSLASIVGICSETSIQIAPLGSTGGDGPRFISVNLGWIEEDIQTSDERLPPGFGLIRRHELDHLIDYVLDSTSAHSTGVSDQLNGAIVGLDPSSLPKNIAQHALFSQIPTQAVDSSSSLTAEEGNVAFSSEITFEKVVAEQNAEAVAAFVVFAITHRLAELLSVAATIIDPRQSSLLSLGLDSLAAVELRNWILGQFEAPLQTADILCDQTVQRLTEKIVTSSKLMSARVGGE